MDHVIPLKDIQSRLHAIANCVVACEKCNSSKESPPAVKESPWWSAMIEDALSSLELTTQRGMYRLIEYTGQENAMGSFSKWKKHWAKHGRFE